MPDVAKFTISMDEDDRIGKSVPGCLFVDDAAPVFEEEKDEEFCENGVDPANQRVAENGVDELDYDDGGEEDGEDEEGLRQAV